MSQFDEQLDSWLDQVEAEPTIQSLSEDDQERVGLIVTLVVQVMIQGYDKQPSEWTTEMLHDLFVNRFVPLLDKDEQEARLFELIPVSLKALFDVILPNDPQALAGWVAQHRDQLVHLYDPTAAKFYQDLQSAMMRDGVDTADETAVAKYTRDYLRLHPEQGKSLFTKHSDN